MFFFICGFGPDSRCAQRLFVHDHSSRPDGGHFLPHTCLVRLSSQGRFDLIFICRFDSTLSLLSGPACEIRPDVGLRRSRDGPTAASLILSLFSSLHMIGFQNKMGGQPQALKAFLTFPSISPTFPLLVCKLQKHGRNFFGLHWFLCDLHLDVLFGWFFISLWPFCPTRFHFLR